MAINRFSRGPIEADIQSTFIPLPIDLINQQGESMQNRYDTTKAFIDANQEAYYGVKGLSPDTEVVKNITSQYDADIENAIKGVGGDIGKLKGFADELGKKVKKDIMTGHLSAIHNNYVKAQNHLKEVEEQFKSGKISAQGRDRALASISSFKGTTETGYGGYTSPNLYTPTEYLEGGKVADEYGKVLADQYDSQGRQFKNAKSASAMIERNLWNNPQLLANAKEQVWATYGDLPPDKEHIAVSAYLKNLADSAGFKVAYQQIFKPEPVSGSEKDDLFGGLPIAVDIQGAKPLRNMFNLEGTNFFDEAEKAESITTAGKVSAALVPETVMYVNGTPIATSATQENRTKKEEILLEANEKARKVLEKLTKTQMVKDIADAYGVDLSTPNVETMNKLKDAMEAVNKSSASTRVIYRLDEKTKWQFENLLNSGNILRMQVTDETSGKDLTYKEKKEVLNKYLNSDKKGGEGSIFLGGSILDSGQPYPVGTMSISVNEGGEPRQLLVDLGQNKNTQEYFYDRALAAYNSGASFYKTGNTTVQFLRDNKTGLVNAYIDGRPATNYEVAKLTGVQDKDIDPETALDRTIINFTKKR